MKKLCIDVAGMHCRSCEILLEKSLAELPGVKKVSADQRKGTVEIDYDQKQPAAAAIEAVVRDNGYSLGKGRKLPWLNSNGDDYAETGVIALALLTVYYLLKTSGFSFGGLAGVADSPTLAVAFLVGLTAGVSSCMALVGGLVLGISAKWNADHAENSRWSRFEPHLYFHFGRIVGFGILGGLLGLFGAFLHVSNTFLGLMTFAVGGLMLFLGANLTGLSPRLSATSITLPKFLGRNVGANQESTGTGAALTGALTFFLPCGFTLAMQAYAISTGSFATGALTMAFFALGTAPGLLGVGALTAVLKGDWAKRFFRFTGVVVLFLGIFNVSNAYTLLSLGLPVSASPASATVTAGPVNADVQEVRMVENDFGYSPNVIPISPNRKIRLVVEAKSPYSCASQLIIPSLGISKQLQSGENVIEFTSPPSGEVRFSCSMGMYTGKFVVSESGTPAQATTIPSQGRSGGCPMMHAAQP
jgi:sulfite exporter TauE/SafE/copper chaperone CopZ